MKLRGWRCSLEVENLSSMCKVLHSISRRKRRQAGRGERGTMRLAKVISLKKVEGPAK